MFHSYFFSRCCQRMHFTKCMRRPMTKPQRGVSRVPGVTARQWPDTIVLFGVTKGVINCKKTNVTLRNRRKNHAILAGSADMCIFIEYEFHPKSQHFWSVLQEMVHTAHPKGMAGCQAEGGPHFRTPEPGWASSNKACSHSLPDRKSVNEVSS